ncbi:MAG: transcription elongation factor GreA [Clostridiales bacterium]|nr:transcription elongation factor GreA [Clostridiales bacterium]
MPKEYIMTAASKRELEERLEHIKMVEMPAVVEEIAKARAQGDLSENAEYDLAREEQAKLQGEIDAIKEKLTYAKVLDEKSINDEIVSIGCTVEVIEADIADGLPEVEKCGLTRTDIIAGFLTRMSVNDMRANKQNRPILGDLTDEDYATAGSELLAGKRYKKEELTDKGFTEAELSLKVKGRGKVDTSKCQGIKSYTIVGSHEADALNGKISNESRVGAALLDKEVGDVVMVGDLQFKILDINVDKKAMKK